MPCCCWRHLCVVCCVVLFIPTQISPQCCPDAGRNDTCYIFLTLLFTHLSSHPAFSITRSALLSHHSPTHQLLYMKWMYNVMFSQVVWSMNTYFFGLYVCVHVSYVCMYVCVATVEATVMSTQFWQLKVFNMLFYAEHSVTRRYSLWLINNSYVYMI